MERRQNGSNRKPTMTSEIIEGEPIRVGEREIVPVVRVTSHDGRRAHVGSHQAGGYGWGFVQLTPIAILERSPAGEHRLPIQDQTAQALGRLLLAACIIPLLLGVLVSVARKK
jgi:uncharacterized spore protein YtfJ